VRADSFPARFIPVNDAAVTLMALAGDTGGSTSAAPAAHAGRSLGNKNPV